MSPAVESPTGQPLAAWLRIAIAFVGLLVGAGILVAGIGMLNEGNGGDAPTTIPLPTDAGTPVPTAAPTTR